MTGWTDYAFSGDNVAAHQAGLQLLPPSLEVKGPDGRWHTAIEDIGMPVGRPQTVVVDLSGTSPRGRARGPDQDDDADLLGPGAGGLV